MTFNNCNLYILRNTINVTVVGKIVCQFMVKSEHQI